MGSSNADLDGNPSYIRILEEVKENLKDIQYYAEDFHKRSALTKKYVINYSHLC